MISNLVKLLKVLDSNFFVTNLQKKEKKPFFLKCNENTKNKNKNSNIYLCRLKWLTISNVLNYSSNFGL